MSDNEGLDDDVTLPRATVYKLITEMLPPEVSCSKETRDLVIECCNEFVHLLASEANEVCEKDSKKTISPEHVLMALKSLGFDEYVKEVQAAGAEHRVQQKERDRKMTRLEDSGMSQEELLRKQQELFARSRARLYGTPLPDPSSSEAPPSNSPSSSSSNPGAPPSGGQ
ncbi:MAG: TATA binding protein-associated phosphoprotein [Piptocephalis tieghemiana]|nr:MAG: TATA binding protein-associated phosphoprotein [Piptocephalis tieghemiana]